MGCVSVARDALKGDEKALKLNEEPLRSHHTNSFAHIIIKFKNKKVSLFFKNVALCSSLGGKYYRYIILLPI